MNPDPNSSATTGLRDLAKHSAVYTTAEILKKGIGFLMIPLYTHYLSPADYGLTEILSLILEILSMLVGARILAAQTRYYHIYESYEEKREVYTTSLLFGIFSSVFTVVILLFFSRFFALFTLGSASFAPHYRLILVCFGIQNVYLLAENDLITRKKSLFFSSLSIALMFIGLSLNILFLSVFKLGVWAILWSMFFTKLANLGAVPATVWNDRIRFSKQKLWQMIRYGLPLVPAAFSMFAIHYSDRFFLQRHCSLAEVGIYSLGYKFGMIISVLITTPFQRAWATHSFEIAKRPEAPLVYARTFTYFAFLLILAGLCISVLISDTIGFLAGTGYSRAALITPVVVLAYVLMGLANFSSLGIMLEMHTAYLSYIHLPLAGLNLLLNWFLIKYYGIWGAAYSTLLTFAAMFIIVLVVAQRVHPIKYEYRRLTILFSLAILLYSLTKLLSFSQPWNFLFHCSTIALFPTLLLFLKFFTPNELSAATQRFSFINRLLPKRIG